MFLEIPITNAFRFYRSSDKYTGLEMFESTWVRKKLRLIRYSFLYKIWMEIIRHMCTKHRFLYLSSTSFLKLVSNREKYEFMCSDATALTMIRLPKITSSLIDSGDRIKWKHIQHSYFLQVITLYLSSVHHINTIPPTWRIFQRNICRNNFDFKSGLPYVFSFFWCDSHAQVFLYFFS